MDNIAKSHFYTERRIALLELVKSLHDADLGIVFNVPRIMNLPFQMFLKSAQKLTSYSGPVRSAQLPLARLGTRLRKSDGEFDILTLHYACNNNILKIFIRLLLSLTIVLTLHFSFHLYNFTFKSLIINFLTEGITL